MGGPLGSEEWSCRIAEERFVFRSSRVVSPRVASLVARVRLKLDLGSSCFSTSVAFLSTFLGSLPEAANGSQAGAAPCFLERLPSLALVSLPVGLGGPGLPRTCWLSPLHGEHRNWNPRPLPLAVLDRRKNS